LSRYKACKQLKIYAARNRPMRRSSYTYWQIAYILSDMSTFCVARTCYVAFLYCACVRACVRAFTFLHNKNCICVDVQGGPKSKPLSRIIIKSY